MLHNNNRALLAYPKEVSDTQPSLQGSSGPLYFGTDNRPLFGWLYTAEQIAPHGLGLLVCNPFGNEAICAHRSIRHVCERASRAGIPALMFDYDGTGDSAGHDLEPGRINAWVRSIHLAVDELRRRTGCDRVCLLGLRLGAMLAALTAAQRTDIAALIAVAPVVSGKTYLRELRILQRAIDAKRGLAREPSDDLLETAGFVLSAETQAALRRLDLDELERTAPDVLVLDRAELPGDLRWTGRLRDQGARVKCLAVTGYTEMMLDSHESVVPRELIETAIGWLSEVGTVGSEGKLARRIPDPPAEPAPKMTLPPGEFPDPVTGPAAGIAVEECAVRFGAAATLFGIVSVPVRTQTPGGGTPNGKAVLLLNSGAVHHIGPNRLYVSLARHLAGRGYTVLRMDIAGVGNSPPHPGERENIVYSKHALQDIAAALTYLRSSWNVEDVSTVGLCSGAYNAFKTAVAGLPVRTAILINPLTFFWKEGMSLRYPEHRIAADMMRYRRNLLRLAPWRKLLRGGVDPRELSQVLLRRAWRTASASLRTVARLLHIPLADDLPSELRAVAHAGVRLEFVFAEHEPGQELLWNQGGSLARRLLRKGHLKFHKIAGTDHTFTDLTGRSALVTALDGALSEA